jgi:hypothetical protein
MDGTTYVNMASMAHVDDTNDNFNYLYMARI